MPQSHYPTPYPAPPTQYPRYPQYQQHPQYQQYPQPYQPIGYGTGRHGAYPSAEQDYEPPRHSGLGIVSLVLAVLAGVVLVCTLIAGVGMLRTNPNIFRDGKDPALVGIQIFFTIGGAMTLVGLGLGIGGMAEPNRKKVLAALGLAFNATIILGVLGLMALGAAR